MSAAAKAFPQTGPRTIAGKETSSSNATLHGGTSKKLIVTGENAADFHALLEELLTDYQPDTPQSRLFVENMATAQWLLWRRQRAYNAIEFALYQEEADEAKWTEAHLKRLALADRYKTQAERALKRALTNIQSLQNCARGEKNRQIRQAQWAAEQSVRERRMTLQEQKFDLAKARTAAEGIRFAKNAVSSPLGAEPAQFPVESWTATALGRRENLNAASVTSLLQCQQA